MKKETYDKHAALALKAFSDAGIILTEKEKANIEVADFGLGMPEKVGLQLLVYINTEKVCAKEMVLLPYQTCPEHKHIPSATRDGKEETFRCRRGKVYLYVTGEGKKEDIKAILPPTDTSVYHEIELSEGEQYTLMPETWHWFQAGDEGAIISEFSTTSTDETDVFTDTRIRRIPEIED